MDDNSEFVTAIHNGEKYQYKKLSSFDDYGLPKPFQDCSYILKYFSNPIIYDVVLQNPLPCNLMEFLS